MYALDWLGPVLLQRDGTPVPLPIRKTLALLVLLARSGAMPRERIVAVLWPALDESTARRNLRRELARLRDLGAEGLVQAEGDLLQLAPGTVLAAQAFEAELQAHRPDDALARWRGSPADGLHLDDATPWNEWMAEERRRLDALRAQALASSAERHEAAGAFDVALQRVQALLSDDPLQERHHERAMRLLDRLGRREEALAQFDTCVRQLRDELGLEPMAQTRALAAALRGGADRLPVAAPARARLDAPAATPATLVPTELPFMGREADVAWLEHAWRGDRPILIEADGGIGKTRLATDFAAAHGPYARVACRPGDAELPLAATTRALRALAGPEPDVRGLPRWVLEELSRLMPELGSGPQLPLRSEEERVRFSQACAWAWEHWTAYDFDAVVVDDWHLADPASQSLLMQMHRDARRPVRLLLLYRPDLAPAAQALLQREREAGAPHRRLEPLPPDAILALVQRLSGRAEPRRFAAMLSRATDGNPFYVAETLRHLVEQGLLDAAPDGLWRTPYDDQADAYRELPLPQSVQQAVRARVERLGERARRVLEAASLAAEPLAAAMLAPACALSEVEASLALEEALQARLLRDDDGRGLSFAHDLVRQALESALDPARRRSVHRRLALGAEAAGMAPARIAAHHEAGGEPSRAVRWRHRAGDDAMRLLELDEAIVQWRQALADGAPTDEALRLHRRIVRALDMRDRTDEARGQAEDLLRVASQGGLADELRAEAMIAVASLYVRNERGGRALALLDSLPALPTPRLQALALQVRSEVMRDTGHMEEGRRLAREALALGALDTDEQGLLLDTLILADFHCGRMGDALAFVEQSLALSRARGDQVGVARALGRRGVGLLNTGQLAEAEAALQESADLSAALGLPGLQRHAWFNLCVLRSAQSRPEAVLRSAVACWDIAPPMGLSPMRVMVQVAFVEAHGALGDLGAARTWLLRAADEATAIEMPELCASVVLTGAELLALLGDGERLAPLRAMLETSAAAEAGYAREMWLVLAECDLNAGRADSAGHHHRRAGAAVDAGNDRIAVRGRIVEAALLLAAGHPQDALQHLPDDGAAGLNDELRWRALAVRLRAEAALGGCAPEALAAADAALARDGVHAPAALLLHEALLQAAPTPARRKAWRLRVEGLAQSLHELPVQREAFLQRFPPGR